MFLAVMVSLVAAGSGGAAEVLDVVEAIYEDEFGTRFVPTQVLYENGDVLTLRSSATSPVPEYDLCRLDERELRGLTSELARNFSLEPKPQVSRSRHDVIAASPRDWVLNLVWFAPNQVNRVEVQAPLQWSADGAVPDAVPPLMRRWLKRAPVSCRKPEPFVPSSAVLHFGEVETTAPESCELKIAERLDPSKSRFRTGNVGKLEAFQAYVGKPAYDAVRLLLDRCDVVRWNRRVWKIRAVARLPREMWRSILESP